MTNKETRTAAALAAMIKQELAVAGADVVVTAEQTVGWTATVIAPQTNAAAAHQLKADVIAAKLRVRFDLKE